MTKDKKTTKKQNVDKFPVGVRSIEIVESTELCDEKLIKQWVSHKYVKQWAYIKHDKDVKQEVLRNEDGVIRDEHGNVMYGPVEDVSPHYHVILKFKNVVRSSTLRNMFKDIQGNKVNDSCFQKIGSSFEDALLYLIHGNNIDKYQYSIDEIKTNVRNKERIIKELLEDSKRCKNITEVKRLILSGEIKRFNVKEYISLELYTKHKGLIEKTFEYADMLNEKIDRDMKVIYAEGDSSLGKTSWVKDWLSKKDYNGIYVSGSSNDPLDKYRGEEAIILDDLRPYSFDFADLIKLLDNYTNTSVKSRFYNKDLSNCKIIVITSVISLGSFYELSTERQRNSSNYAFVEPIKQLFKRARFNLRFEGDKVEVWAYNEKEEEGKQWKKVKEAKNKFFDMYNKETIENIISDETKILFGDI